MATGKSIRVILTIPAGADAKTARKELRSLLTGCGLMPVWQEEIADESAAIQLKVQGRKVEHFGGDAEKCRKEIQKYAASAQSAGARVAAFFSVIPGLLIVFFPKCAFCWAAYASALNGLGITLPYLPWMKHVFAGLLVLSVFLLYRGARRRQKWMPFSVMMAGMLIVLCGHYLIGSKLLVWSGIGLLFTGSLLNAMPDAWLHRIEMKIPFLAERPG